MDIIKKYEMDMWEAALNKDANKFLELVAEDAIMVCGGYRCLGKEYAEYIKDYDISSYVLLAYEIIFQTESLVQIHYVMKTETEMQSDSDLAGEFHITSTWRKMNEGWKLIFNLDSRILK